MSFTSQILKYLGSSGFLLKLLKIPSKNRETKGWCESLSYPVIETTLERAFLATQILLYKDSPP